MLALRILVKIIVGGSGVVRESVSESLDVFRRLFSRHFKSDAGTRGFCEHQLPVC